MRSERMALVMIASVLLPLVAMAWSMLLRKWAAMGLAVFAVVLASGSWWVLNWFLARPIRGEFSPGEMLTGMLAVLCAGAAVVFSVLLTMFSVGALAVATWQWRRGHDVELDAQ